MSNQYFNFSYDPAKQGFDNSTWRTVYGNTAVVGGKLQLSQGMIIHYGDILRGDAVFSINIAAPVPGDHSSFGFTQYSKGVYAYFNIIDNVLTAETSDGVTSSSISIPWEEDWTDTDTEFRIKWEAGLVTFFVAGNIKASIGYSTTLNIPQSVVPNDPMSLYVASDGADTFILNYIIVKSIQSYLFSTGNIDSNFEKIVKESDKMIITDVPTVVSATTMSINKYETLTLTDTPTIVRPDLLTSASVNDSITISESNSTNAPA